MSKKFKELGKIVSEIKKEIEAVEDKITEAEMRRGKAEFEIDALTGELEAALVADDSAQVDLCEGKIAELKKIVDRNLLLISALPKKVEQLNEGLAEAQDNLGLRFSELAERWLIAEISAFDLAAKNLGEKLRRLLAVQEQLRERDFSRVYSDAVGPAGDVLPGFRIPIIKGFDRAAFLAGGQRQFGQDFRDKIYSEIIK